MAKYSPDAFIAEDRPLLYRILIAIRDLPVKRRYTKFVAEYIDANELDVRREIKFGRSVGLIGSDLKRGWDGEATLRYNEYRLTESGIAILDSIKARQA